MSSDVPDPRRWIALVLLCATQFMLIIDVSIVNVALPTIQRDLEFTNRTSSRSPAPTPSRSAGSSCSAAAWPTCSGAGGCSCSGWGCS